MTKPKDTALEVELMNERDGDHCPACGAWHVPNDGANVFCADD